MLVYAHMKKYAENKQQFVCQLPSFIILVLLIVQISKNHFAKIFLHVYKTPLFWNYSIHKLTSPLQQYPRNGLQMKFAPYFRRLNY